MVGSFAGDRRRRAVAIAAIAVACSGGLVRARAQPSPADRPSTKISRSTRGMVVTSAPAATAIGAAVLERGGNAVDAAIAVAFALSVVDFGSFGLGGRTQMLIRSADGRFTGIDGSIQVPAAYRRSPEHDGIGYTTIGVPGSVAALIKAHALFGSRPLPELLAPAIALAEEGFVLSAGQASTLARSADALRRFDGSRRQFLQAGGEAPRAGVRLTLPALGQTIRAIAAGGHDAFYRGPIARQIAADVRAHGGFLSESDLAGYEAQLSTVVRGSYRGYDLTGTHAPAAGSTVIETLHILERFDLSSAASAEWAALVAQALRLAFQDQYRDFGSPAAAAHTMVSKAWAAERAQAVQVPGAPRRASRDVFRGWADEGHTTHFSVADAKGGLVASTQTLGSGMGSKVVTPGLGFLYAATMGFAGASASEPGQRATTSMSPFMVTKDGRPVLVLGAAGGMRIISSIVEATSRVIDQRLAFADAIAAPRVHPDPGSYIAPAGEAFALETGASGWRDADLERIRTFGFEAVAQATGFATIHGIHFDPTTQEYVGVADPRGGGAAAGPR